MLKIDLKKCCKTCDDIDIKFDTVERRYAFESLPIRIITEYCSHCNVCWKYKECDKIWPSQT